MLSLWDAFLAREDVVYCRHLTGFCGVLPGVRNDEDLLFQGEMHC